MYTLEGVSSVETSILLMKSINKTETPIFKSVIFSLFPKAIFLMFFQENQMLVTSEIMCISTASRLYDRLNRTLTVLTEP